MVEEKDFPIKFEEVNFEQFNSEEELNIKNGNSNLIEKFYDQWNSIYPP